MKTLFKAVLTASTVLAGLSSASAGPNMNLNVIRFSPPELRMQHFSTDRLSVDNPQSVPGTNRKPKIAQKPPLFSNVPPKKDFKTITAAGKGLRVPVTPETTKLGNAKLNPNFAGNTPKNDPNTDGWITTVNRGLPSQHRSGRWQVPGLIPDLTSLPHVGAGQGGTEPGDPNPVVDKLVVEHGTRQ